MPVVPAPEINPPEQVPAQELGKCRSSCSAGSPARPVRVSLRVGAKGVKPEKRPPYQQIWFRLIDRAPDDDALHRSMLAYASDFHLIGTAMLPHGISYLQHNVQVASLDHALWFHRPFRADEWLLYSCDSPSAQGARAMTRGLIFARDGRLVASTAQEGLIRLLPEYHASSTLLHEWKTSTGRRHAARGRHRDQRHQPQALGRHDYKRASYPARRNAKAGRRLDRQGRGSAARAPAARRRHRAGHRFAEDLEQARSGPRWRRRSAMHRPASACSRWRRSSS
jgi:hypothetical protein